MATLSSLSFHLPEGWKLAGKTRGSIDGQQTSGDDGGTVLVDDLSSFPGDTLDSQAREAISEAKTNKVSPVRGPDITVDGVECWVVTGSSHTFGVYYAFGAVTKGHDVDFLFQYTKQAADAQAAIQSVQASITWT